MDNSERIQEIQRQIQINLKTGNIVKVGWLQAELDTIRNNNQTATVTNDDQLDHLKEIFGFK